jgi:uncharacterized protein
MTIFAGSDPLTDAELDRLANFLENCNAGAAMNLEELDGFFCALIAGPSLVPPSVYLPEVWGGEDQSPEFKDLDEANEILGLLMRHWNYIAHTLGEGEVYIPLLFEDENGVSQGNEWANAFLLGTHFDHAAWSELMEDEKRGGCMFPMLWLHHEHDEDPQSRPKPLTVEKREELLETMAAGLLLAHEYFRARRVAEPSRPATLQPRRGAQRIGRNEPCPCGSGKKYKQCCGGAIIQ